MAGTLSKKGQVRALGALDRKAPTFAFHPLETAKKDRHWRGSGAHHA
jgi:hypothetical protein